MKLHLAPMEGVIDHHMRRLLCQSGAIDVCVTEFVRVTDHLLPGKVFHRYCPELLVTGEAQLPCPIKLQLLGSNPQALARNAAKAARLGAAGVDLNFGCPAKTVNKNRGGACLLDETGLVYEIVSAVRQAVPAHIPVTAKIRLGYGDREPYLANARAIAAAGADELVVHARSKVDGYKPPAYWHHIGEIKGAVDIPVVANGEIWTVEDYLRCREQSGCDDAMLGRGLLAQPDLAQAIKAYLRGEDYTLMDWQSCLSLLWRFYRETSDAYPKKHLGNRVKQWLVYLRRSYPEAKVFFEAVKRERTTEGFEAAFSEHIKSAPQAAHCA
jgi:tRNA-dihydrouridine synthase C